MVVADHYQSVVTVFGFLEMSVTAPVTVPSALYLATRRLPLYPELESEVEDGSRSFDDLEFLEWGLAETTLPSLPWPYSLVELTDLVVSAGR